MRSSPASPTAPSIFSSARTRSSRPASSSAISALVVVDEQHRFGVHQRLALTAKGGATDVLVMTATPIPRTLVLTYYGDMDVSRLTEKPAGRRPIDTRAVPLDRLGEVVERIRAATATAPRPIGSARWSRSRRCSTSPRRRSATPRSRRRSAPIVGLVHGRMKPAERDAVMARFLAGDIRVLVATTVVEVGVDVPDATIMVIEHAERFGLAQLHQLRGRVGRSDRPSVCLLLYKAPLGAVARDRLAIMRETEDGFRIAEEDLRLRGGGEILGTRQSGTPGFRIARPEHHGALMEIARDDAAPGRRRPTRISPASAARRSGSCSICSGATRRSGCHTRRLNCSAARTRRFTSSMVTGSPGRITIGSYSGVTSPAEMTILAASSTDMSRRITSLALRTKTRKPASAGRRRSE